MTRLPNNRRFYDRRSEDLAASAVAAALRAEGRVVEDGYRPREGERRSPDWMMTIDGEPTALEVTRLLPPAEVQSAEHLVTRMESDLRSTLAPVVDLLLGQVLVNLSYIVHDVARLDRAGLARDAEQLGAEVRTALASGKAGANQEVPLVSALP